MKTPLSLYEILTPRSELAATHAVDVEDGLINPYFKEKIKFLLVNSIQSNFYIKEGDKIS